MEGARKSGRSAWESIYELVNKSLNVNRAETLNNERHIGSGTYDHHHRLIETPIPEERCKIASMSPYNSVDMVTVAISDHQLEMSLTEPPLSLRAFN